MVKTARTVKIKKSLLIGLGFAVATAVSLIPVPNYYRSEARMLPVEPKSGSGGLGSISAAATALGLNLPGAEGPDANLVEILQSRTISEQLLQTKYHFRVRTWRFGREQVRTQSLLAYLEADNLDSGVKKIANVLTVNKDLKTKVISVSAETKSADLSQAVVQTAIGMLESYVQKRGRTRGGAKAIFAEARLTEAQQELSRAEDEVARFGNANRNYLASSDPQIRMKGIHLEGVLKLQQELVVSLALSREQALLEEKNDIPILNVMDPGNLPLEKSKPSRGLYTEFAFLVGVLATFVWLDRKWVLAQMLESGAEESSASAADQVRP